MPEWSKLSPNLKMCVKVYQEREAGRDVWATRLVELLKGDVSKLEVSKNEDKLMDLGILNKQYKKVDGLWTSCYLICDESESFIKNIVENLDKGEK